METEIEVKAKIEKVRITTKEFMLGVQCGSEKDKKEVMINKKNLGDQDIYIENDLTWTERKIRERARDRATAIKTKESRQR